jgi:hypothetical protein
MPTKHRSTCVTTEADPAATLEAQIRARFIKSQHAIMDGQDNHAHPLIAESFCDETNVSHALGQFYDCPTNESFAQALGCLVVQASQNMVTRLKTVDSMQAYWCSTSTNVVIFESAAYLWSMLSFDVREIVKCEFDKDREAVLGAVLGGFAAATKLMKNKWPGFLPEGYSLSRIFLYPNDSIKAAEYLCRVLLASEGTSLPLSSSEINESLGRALNDAEQVLFPLVKKFYDEIKPGLGEAISGLASCYLDNRMD